MTQKAEILSHLSSFPVADLFHWYDRHARKLPWRAVSPEMAPAYHVFLSELMLQQTGVSTVIPYFNRFIKKWPDIYALAQAEEAAVLAEWAGLGYYARARNMLKAARMIVTEHGGQFPQSPEALQKLSGIGPYTAGAIAAIAFGQPAVVLDGNIERILIRYAGLHGQLRTLKPELRALYAHIRPEERPSDFPQALMDIGAMICQPRIANCGHCPLRSGCRAAGLENPASLPQKAEKKAKPTRQGSVVILYNAGGQVLLHRRASKGLLGGMLAFPSYGWDGSARPDWLDSSTEGVTWLDKQIKIGHVFTHFSAEITVYQGMANPQFIPPSDYFWQSCHPDRLPTLMAKCYHAVSD